MVTTDIIHNAQDGLQKLKTKYIYANAYIVEIEATKRNLQDELNKLDSNIKYIEQNLSGNATSEQLKLLMDGKTRLNGVQGALNYFNHLRRKHHLVTPDDKFEEFIQELQNMADELMAGHIIRKEDCKRETEEIASYSNKCINFVEFYTKSKSELETMLKILQEFNKTFEQSAKTQNWGEWLKSILKPLWTPVFNAIIAFFTNQILKYLFSVK